MQAIEYNPFEEEDEGREMYPDDVGLEGTEEYLPAGHARIPDVLPGEESQPLEEAGGQYADGQNTGELEDAEEGDESEESENLEELEGLEESKDSEVPEDSEDDSKAPEDSGEVPEESEEKAHRDGRLEETRSADDVACQL